MFRLVLGRSGAGKSEKLLHGAAQSARDGKQVLLLVPEQFSFATERKMLALVHGRQLLNVSVLSFSRLCENIFRSMGGIAGKRLTDVARLVLMKLAVQETADRLVLYTRQSSRTDFLNTMLQTIDELKSSGAYPQRLESMLSQLDEGQLGAKLADITAIYQVYQGIVERNYQDPLDDIAKAVELTRGGNFFRDRHIYIDGFSFFSPPERELIEIMLEQAESVTLALCADSLSRGGALDIFHDQKQLAYRFITGCARLDIPCKKPLVLTENLRTASPALRSVEEFIATGRCTPPEKSDEVTIARCDNKYDEIRYVAAEITRLVREKGYRYRDTAVVCRRLEDYETALETIFPAYGIPLFFDRKENVISRPIAAMVTAALDAVKGEWKTEAILRIARCPASGITMEESARLENYLYIWSIDGKVWDKPFTGAPGGLSGALTDSDRTELEALEALRLRLITPLSRLKKQLRRCTGSGFALGLYNYLCDMDAGNNLKLYFGEDADGQMQESDRLYGAILDILDIFADTMEDVGLPAATFIEMFQLALDSVELGQIPNTNDQTIAGSADRVRLDSPRAVFVVGVNEGVFPGKHQPYGVFSDTERELLVEHGIELSASPLQRSLLERFFLYSAVCAPRERLWISYSGNTLSGEQQEPSALVGQLLSILPQSATLAQRLPDSAYIVDIFTAREQYLRLAAAGRDAASLRQAILEEGDGGFLELADSLAADAPAAGITPETAAKLINGRLKLSPTAIERFYRCPYTYLCDNMLRLRKRKRVEYTPLESGTAIHYVLEHLLQDLGGKGIAELSDQELEQRISNCLQEFIESVAQDTSPLSSRFRYQFGRLVSVLMLVVRHIGDDFSQSLFTAAGFEVSVGSDQEVQPLSLTARDGTPITVNGKIDRVDIYENGSDRFARVVDYKSGGKDFSLGEVFYGLNMQMLLYLFALCQDRDSRFGELQPAGILYMSGKVSPAELPPGADRDTLRKVIDSTLKMKGLLLEDEMVLRAMERELAGRYIPAKLTKNGSLDARSSIKTAAEFQHIKSAVTMRVADMGETVTCGSMSPIPARGNGTNPCDYCDYGILCRNKNTDLFRDITKPPEGKGQLEQEKR